MTQNQINYQNLLELQRSNREREKETHRSNTTVEKETARSNLARETETNRSNLAREAEDKRSHQAQEAETNRSNLAREFETNRANVAKEQLQKDTLAETQRSNRAQEQLKSSQIAETHRTNVANEAIRRTSNAIEQQKANEISFTNDLKGAEIALDREKLEETKINNELVDLRERAKNDIAEQGNYVHLLGSLVGSQSNLSGSLLRAASGSGISGGLIASLLKGGLK